MNDAFLQQRDVAHVWELRLDNEDWDKYVDILTVDEAQKISSYKNKRAQIHARRCRVAVRLVLAKYLKQTPSQIAFSLGQFGKPKIMGRQLHFNLSHSDSTAVLAICGFPIGIDLELCRGRHLDVDGVAKIVFHPSEMEIFSHCSKEEKIKMFYRIWTQKEAYSKYLGKGLNIPFDQIRFSNFGAGKVRLVIDENIQETICYTHEVINIRGHASSLCVASEELHCFQFRASPFNLESISWIQ
jgi:4'-phosphopantetheinyl transferase